MPDLCVPQNLPEKPRGRVIVVGAGKASAAMAQAFEKAWGGPVEGLIVTRYGHAVPCQHIEIVEWAHPVPADAGTKAARRARDLWAGVNAGVEGGPAASRPLAPGRAGEIWAHGQKIGAIGQLHPARAKAMKLDGEAAYLEIELTPLMEASSPRAYEAATAYPTHERDIALLLPVSGTWQEGGDGAA